MPPFTNSRRAHTGEPAFMTATLGVLGGMGPAATARFLQRFTEMWPASCDQDHPRIVLLSETQLPDRTASLAGAVPDLRPMLRSSLRQLFSLGVDLVAV